MNKEEWRNRKVSGALERFKKKKRVFINNHYDALQYLCAMGIGKNFLSKALLTLAREEIGYSNLTEDYEILKNLCGEVGISSRFYNATRSLRKELDLLMRRKIYDKTISQAELNNVQFVW